jgi:conjugative transfer signal peptidase TraF
MGLLAVTSWLITGGFLHLARLRINVTQSLPTGVYRMETVPIHRGSYVLACPPPWAGELARRRHYLWSGTCPGGSTYLGKQVVAVAGDTVELDDDGLLVNRSRIPNSAPLESDTRGRPMPQLRGRWVLPVDAIWLDGVASTRSYDSRYFGAVQLSGVRSALQPVER